MFTRARTMFAAVAIAATTVGAIALAGAAPAAANGWTGYRRTVALDAYGTVNTLTVDPVTRAAFGLAYSPVGAGQFTVVKVDGSSGATSRFSAVPGDGYATDLVVDPDQRLLYVLVSAGDVTKAQIDVLNLDSGATVATITGAALSYPLSMAIDPQTHDGYLIDPDSGSPVLIVDGTTHTLKGAIGGPRMVNSADIAFNPVTHRLYVTNDGDGTVAANVSVIDPSTAAVVSTIADPRATPYRIAVDDTSGRVYVANMPDYIDGPGGGTTVPGDVIEIDGTKNTVTRTLSSALLQVPYGMAVDAATGTLLVAGGGAYNPEQPPLVAVDLATGSADSAGSFPGSVSTNDVVLDEASRTVWTANDPVDEGAPSLSILDLKPKPASARIAAPDRFSNAVEIAKAAFPTTAPVVYVATGLNYPDALGAGAAAASAGGPLLLTTPTSLPASVSQEIQSLQPQRIVVVGGPASVSDDVVRQLSLLAPTVRQGGTDRYDASRNIVAGQFPHATTAFIATGANFPDALSATSAAASKSAPVILIPGTASSLDPRTTALLQSLGVTDITITGGPNSVSPAIEAQLQSTYGASHVIRLGGADRFEASAAINNRYFSTAGQAYLATGSNFPDALAGGVLAATKSVPLLVVRGECIPASSVAALQGWGTTNVTLLGGTASLTPAVGTLHPCP